MQQKKHRTRNTSLREQSQEELDRGFIQAIERKSLQRAEEYLKANASPRSLAGNSAIFSPAHLVLRAHGKADCANWFQKLYEHGTDMFVEDCTAITPLELAIELGNVHVIHWYLKGFDKSHAFVNRIREEETIILDPSSPKFQFQTPLHIALRFCDGNPKIINILLEAGARVDLGQAGGQTPLHLCVEKHYWKCLPPLLQYSTQPMLSLPYKGKSVLEMVQHEVRRTETEMMSGDDIMNIKRMEFILDNFVRDDTKLTQCYNHCRMWIKPDFLSIECWECRKLAIKNIASTAPPSKEPLPKCTRHPVRNLNRAITLSDAFQKQIEDPLWASTAHTNGISSRIIHRQKLTNYANKLKQRVTQFHRRNSSTFREGGWDIQVACNDSLKEQWTNRDSREISAHLKGDKDENTYVEIRELLDPHHPCKRFCPDGVQFGLFAKQDIPLHTWIIEYVGEVKPYGQAAYEIKGHDNKDAQFRFHELHAAPNTDDSNRIIIDASHYSNESVFVNDPRDPELGIHDYSAEEHANAGFFEITANGWPHMFIRSKEVIPEGTEIKVNYGGAYWNRLRKYKEEFMDVEAYYQMRRAKEKTHMDVVKQKGQMEGCVCNDLALPVSQLKDIMRDTDEFHSQVNLDSYNREDLLKKYKECAYKNAISNNIAMAYRSRHTQLQEQFKQKLEESESQRGIKWNSLEHFQEQMSENKAFFQKQLRTHEEKMEEKKFEPKPLRPIVMDRRTPMEAIKLKFNDLRDKVKKNMHTQHVALQECNSLLDAERRKNGTLKDRLRKVTQEYTEVKAKAKIGPSTTLLPRSRKRNFHSMMEEEDVLTRREPSSEETSTESGSNSDNSEGNNSPQNSETAVIDLTMEDSDGTPQTEPRSKRRRLVPP